MDRTQNPSTRSRAILKARIPESHRERYAKYRADGHNAMNAYRYGAKREAPAPLEWHDGGSGEYGKCLYWAEFEMDGLTVRAEMYADDEMTLPDYLGKTTEAECFYWQGDVTYSGEGAGNRPSREARLLVYRDPHNGCREFVWFEAENTEESHYKGLRNIKYGKALARELAQKYVAQDMKMVKELYQMDRQYVGINSIVRIMDFGLGSMAVWGIDFDGDDYTYVDQCAREYASGAISPDQIDTAIQEGVNEAAIMAAKLDIIKKKLGRLDIGIQMHKVREALAQYDKKTGVNTTSR